MFKKITFFIASPFVTIGTYTSYRSLLPKEKKHLHIVFDLDHTLVHTEKKSHFDQLNAKHIRKPDTVYHDYYVWKRPFLVPVIWTLSQFTTLHLMTRASGHYANEICYDLGIGKFFRTLIARENKISNGICKDVTTVDKSIDPHNIILVDDLKYNCCTGQNLYHIPPYYVFSSCDLELVKFYFYVLMWYLKN
jgi:hypothetical protein